MLRECVDCVYFYRTYPLIQDMLTLLWLGTVLTNVLLYLILSSYVVFPEV